MNLHVCRAAVIAADLSLSGLPQASAAEHQAQHDLLAGAGDEQEPVS